MSDVADLAWLAGLFDGEGSLLIQIQLPNHRRRYAIYAPRAAMKLKYGAHALDRFQRRFGGSSYQYADGGRAWSLMGRDPLRVAVRALRPYLEVKRVIADRFLQALDLIPDRKGIAFTKGQRSWSAEAEWTMIDVALTLNPLSSKNAKQKAHAVLVRQYQEGLLHARG